MSLLVPGDVVSLLAEVKSVTGVDRVRLVAEQRGPYQAVESADPVTDTLTLTAHGFADGAVIGFDGDDIPTGLSSLIDYYVVSATADTFQVSLTAGGVPVDFTAAGTGSVFLAIQRAFGTEETSDNFIDGRSMIEALEIMPGYDRMVFFVENMDDTEDASLRRVMCVRGPSASEYIEPVFIYNQQDASLLQYADGTPVQDLEPAEPNAEQTTNKGTAILGPDDAGLGLTADWGGITDAPTTLDGYQISDGQPDLGTPPSDEMVLHKDTNGDAYWAEKYGNECNIGGENFGSSGTFTTTTTVTQIGPTLVIANPGRHVSVRADAYFRWSWNGIGGNGLMLPRIGISLDGGSTFTETTISVRSTDSTDIHSTPLMRTVKGTPTGDIHIRARVAHSSAGGAGDCNILYNQSWLSFVSAPNGDYAETASALSAAVEGTATGSCTKHYSNGTTCLASANVTCTANGGVPSYSYSHSKVSGADSITSGALTQTCTVSGTHTTSDAGATHDTIVECEVTDSAATVATSNECTVTLTYNRTYTAVLVNALDASKGCAYSTLGGTCVASVNLNRSVSGGDGSYSDSWTKESGDGSITSGALTATPTVSHTGSSDTTGTFKDTVTDGHGSIGSDTQVTSFNHFYQPPPE